VDTGEAALETTTVRYRRFSSATLGPSTATRRATGPRVVAAGSGSPTPSKAESVTFTRDKAPEQRASLKPAEPLLVTVQLSTPGGMFRAC